MKNPIHQFWSRISDAQSVSGAQGRAASSGSVGLISDVAQALSIAGNTADWAVLLNFDGEILETNTSENHQGETKNTEAGSCGRLQNYVNVQDRVKFLDAFATCKDQGASKLSHVRMSEPKDQAKPASTLGRIH